MAKAEWGAKRICPACSTRYYDMKKSPPTCPKCGTAFDPETLLRARRGRTADKKVAARPEDLIEVDEVPVTEADDLENTVIEDADELADETEGEVEDAVDLEEAEAEEELA